ncbi:diphthamide biosynthesis protein 4 [Phaeosphaeria sp. MPI-PUGE-AT-0046c]|nr:diphthamide biosynthesis protein 4 [Phaeosphaeria sp. MPI-PUGE-AT-0046c]
MSYTKDYYATLNLSASSSDEHTSQDLRRAYKLSLLAAHPDKNSNSTSPQQQQHTIDQIKEAYAVLSDERNKAEYDNYLRLHPELIGQNSGPAGREIEKEFLMGLEVLDLSDFDVLDPGFTFSNPTPTQAGGSEEEMEVEVEIERNGQMEWTRACRCGDEKGYVILEEELEDAENRGESEVLVGCGGCSLWVRVGFGVEEDED